MVLTNEEWEELHNLKDKEMEVWSQLNKWIVAGFNTYNTYHKGDKQWHETESL